MIQSKELGDVLDRLINRKPLPKGLEQYTPQQDGCVLSRNYFPTISFFTV